VTKLSERKKIPLFRSINLGDPGSGKTGSLAEVINKLDELPIERIIIADFDDGLDVLANYVKPEHQDKVLFQTFRDKLIPSIEGAKYEGAALDMAWVRANTFMKKFEGGANSWGSETLFVVDTLTGMGDAAMIYAKAKEGLNIPDDWRATGGGSRLQDKFTQMLIGLQCHVMLNAHIRLLGGGGFKNVKDKEGSEYQTPVDSDIDGTGYPSALGRILPKSIARHFNIALEWKMVGQLRMIRTVPEDRMVLKAPFKLPQEVPQDTGLLTILKMHFSQAKA
jgi:hypothetical protein